MPAPGASLRSDRLAVVYEPTPHSRLQLSMRPSPTGNDHGFTSELLADLTAVIEALIATRGHWLAANVPRPVHYIVLQSTHPDYFSLGGDIDHLRMCVRRRDEEALRAYSLACVDLLFAWATQLGRHTTSIALVQGRALGGGFETALAADRLIAEEHSDFGFPEILFGLFPCTGGMSLLAQRVGVRQAERMLGDPRIYSAQELYAMGVVDEVCPRGQGPQAVDRFIARHAPQRQAHLALQRERQRLAALNYDNLLATVGEWVAVALTLGDRDLRVMDTLVRIQQTRVKHGVRSP
jgi:DSF synthase